MATSNWTVDQRNRDVRGPGGDFHRQCGETCKAQCRFGSTRLQLYRGVGSVSGGILNPEKAGAEGRMGAEDHAHPPKRNHRATGTG